MLSRGLGLEQTDVDSVVFVSVSLSAVSKVLLLIRMMRYHVGSKRLRHASNSVTNSSRPFFANEKRHFLQTSEVF
ncbi:hypothetical protein HYQ46_007630 [Verticillium longisporum]|nr:hypothetical protein HYQ46_007630 [Verticillium longisporum]